MAALRSSLFPLATVVLGAASACGPAAPMAEAQAGEREAAEIAPTARAVHAADVATIDPTEIEDAEIEKVLGPGAVCRFSYTRAGGPVLAARAPGGGRAVMKLNGLLIELLAEDADGSGLTLVADGVRATVRSLTEDGIGVRSNAEMRFEIEEDLTAGYHGFYECGRP